MLPTPEEELRGLERERENLQDALAEAGKLQRRLARLARLMKVPGATSVAASAIQALDQHHPGWEDLGVVCIRCGGEMDHLTEEFCLKCSQGVDFGGSLRGREV